ncbi:MAG: hypothetical protein NTZ19_02155 [Bacteroidetes bacterium]|nr:hypothetical protein [Bacteroidota bacterium]
MANSMVQWLTMAFIALMHPFYVSVIDINHNTKEGAVELSIRIFTPDLEQTLQKYSSTKVDIAIPKDKALLDKQISNYINQKIQLKINGQPVTVNYVGYEIQNESVWVYAEVPKITTLKKLEVNCNLLYDFKDLQSNIIHVKANGAEKSYKLDYPKTNTSFDF